MKNIQIYFDMDGTIADLYAVENWLPKLRAFDATPYRDAAVLQPMAKLARELNKLHRKGVKLHIVSWLSKVPTESYDKAVIAAKKEWLSRHLKSVEWDSNYFLPHGTPKSSVVEEDKNTISILFDDEEKNRQEWRDKGGEAFQPSAIFDVLQNL